jgi:endoglucanase
VSGDHPESSVSRRAFLKRAAAALVAALPPAWAGGGAGASAGKERAVTAQTKLPRWRGFNLLEMFTTRSDGQWREDDFRWIADWGFDFVRLPMCYMLWIEDNDPLKLHEGGLAKVDRAVALGRKHGLHVCLNFHRGPGYSVNREREEPFDLWKDQAALDAFCLHWATFAECYRGIPSSQVSFNLINEPARVAPEDHRRVVEATVKAIREIDAERLIIADGREWATVPCPELAGLDIAQSCRGYQPMTLTHYEANWVDSAGWPEPVWPDQPSRGAMWNRATLEEHYRPWVELAKSGVGVHCGEMGAYSKTPHGVVLAWMREVLEILTTSNIGYALWNFRGAFGVVDSGRADVAYEDFHGHKLDRKMLELLREF